MEAIKKGRLAAAVSVLAILTGTPALAQDAQPTGAKTSDTTEIVITGSRIRNANFTAPTPVTTVGALQINERAPSNIAEVINQLPQFRTSISPSGSGRVADQQSGVMALLDLRGLGAIRTLTLINGERSVGTTSQGTFDTNMIPISLIDRVEVVTGGASAAYGSDAVAGVANFILKNKMNGFSGSVQAGQSTYGDGDQYVVSLAGGHDFAKGRGHFVIGADYAKSDGIGNMYTRPWGRLEPGLLSVSAAQRSALGLPAQVFANGVEYASYTRGGLIQTPTSSGILYAFGADGTPAVFGQGTVFGSGTSASMTGVTSNYGYTPSSAFQLQNPTDRHAIYARAEFDVSDNLNLYIEANNGEFHMPPQQVAWYNQTFKVATSSLPTALQAQYSTPNVTIGRIFTENGGDEVWQTTTLNRLVVGAKGRVFSDWNWQASYETSKARQDFNTTGLVLGALYKAVYGCAGTTATNPNLTAALVAQVAVYEQQTGKTCETFNPFGVQADNSAGTNYIFNNQHQESTYTQEHAGISLSGSPFALWAGDVSLAVGAEWRKEVLDVVGTTLGANNVYYNGNFGSYAGENTVSEIYAEVGLPLLKDKPFARSLDLNAAIRGTSYDLGGDVTTWKLGAVYVPVEGLKFRATQSRDIRAPNLNELFFVGGALPTTVTNNIVGTYGYGTSGTTTTVGLGNVSLVPEKADTLTAGVVFQPVGTMSGFRMAVDYYKIDVKGAIARLSTAQTMNACSAMLAGGATSCPGIVFSTTGNGIASLANMSQNVNALIVEGVDVELGYSAKTLPFGLPGKVNIVALVNNAMHYDQHLLAGNFELAGSMNGVPEWSGKIDLGYSLHNFGGTLTLRGFSSVKYDTATLYALSDGTSALVVDPSMDGYVNTNANSINKNRFPGIGYIDLSAHYDFSSNVTGFAVVNNLLNRQPPAFAAIAQTTSSRNISYDMIGRYFKLGVRFKY